MSDGWTPLREAQLGLVVRAYIEGDDVALAVLQEWWKRDRAGWEPWYGLLIGGGLRRMLKKTGWKPPVAVDDAAPVVH